jgi:hypothetical protein
MVFYNALTAGLRRNAAEHAMVNHYRLLAVSCITLNTMASGTGCSRN